MFADTLFRLKHKTCLAGILPQSKTDLVFSAPLTDNGDRGVFFVCGGLFYTFFIGFS